MPYLDLDKLLYLKKWAGEGDGQGFNVATKGDIVAMVDEIKMWREQHPLSRVTSIVMKTDDIKPEDLEF